MLPSELKLSYLGHCYVQLPETFVSQQKPAVKGGAIVCIRSIQSDAELLVTWNGQLTAGEHVELDLTFGQANRLKDELVVISLAHDLEIADCSFCRVKLTDSADYTILSEHSSVGLLDTCRLVFRGLVVPIFVSPHVIVKVEVLDLGAGTKSLAMLTKWTEMQFEHDLEDTSKIKTRSAAEPETEHIIKQPVPLVSWSLGLEHKAELYCGSLLVTGNRGSGKTYFLKKLLDDYRQFHNELVNCRQFRGKRPETIKKRFQEVLAAAYEKQPSIIALDDIDSLVGSHSREEEDQGQAALYKKRLVDIFCWLIKQLERRDRSRGNVVLVAACQSLESLDKCISTPQGRSYFSEVIKLDAPTVESKTEILKSIIAEHPQVRCTLSDGQLDSLARKCNTLMPSDLRRIFERSLIKACSRSSLDFTSEPPSIHYEDFVDAMEDYIPINLRGVPLQPKSRRTLDDIGGMREIKEALVKMISYPIKYPGLYRKCALKCQNSVLLYGPPGCGKTLLAEALMNLDGFNSIYVRGPELLSKYIGASEANVRNLFARAQLARPCIIFFDEFESLVAKRGSDSTGVTDRVVNQFLTILDGVERLSSEVFIVAASSRPDMIDSAMLRPGRLDRHVYCPIPSCGDRAEIISRLSKNIALEANIDIGDWARRLDGFTGADIQALLYSAQLKALHKMIGPTAVRSCREELRIIVSSVELEESFREVKPSIDAKLGVLLERHPGTLRGPQEGRVAVRATLA